MQQVGRTSRRASLPLDATALRMSRRTSPAFAGAAAPGLAPPPPLLRASSKPIARNRLSNAQGAADEKTHFRLF